MRKKPWIILTLIFGLTIAASFFIFYVKIFNTPTPRPLPGNRQKVSYSYYRIVDEKTGETLIYVSFITGQPRR